MSLDENVTPSAAFAREIWSISGADAVTFLQGLVSNDVRALATAPGLIWTGFLNPQGKYLADFFILRQAGDAADQLYIDIASDLAPQVMRLLQLYKLRAAVTIARSNLHVTRGLGGAVQGAFTDPRDPVLGWRHYGDEVVPEAADFADRYLALRIAHLIPEYPQELRPNDAYILEFGFERLNGVDFRKGCYVGQEVTARMKHKTELRKGLVRVVLREGQVKTDGSEMTGAAITMEDGREAGRMGSFAAGSGLAWLRFDRAEGVLLCNGLSFVAV